MGTIHPASHLKKPRLKGVKPFIYPRTQLIPGRPRSPIFFKMVSRLGCLFSELVPSVSLRFTCKSSFWNKGREPSFQDSLLTPPRGKETSLQEAQRWFRIQQNRHPPVRLEKQAWVLQHHLKSGHCLAALAHPSHQHPPLALVQTIRGTVLGQLKEADFLSTALTPISEGVVKPRDYEKSDSENVGSLRKK